jgi:N-acetylneuraminic acid mutarotase
MMRKVLSIFILCALISCDEESSPTVNPTKWTEMNSFSGGKRSRLVAFSVNGKGYAGGGIRDTEDGTPQPYFRDFWEYTPETDSWIQKNDLPEIIMGQESCTIGDKAYVLSFGGILMEYTPATDTWTQKKTIPKHRGGACITTVNGKIYAGTGQALYGGENYNDWWEYNPATNEWTEKASLPADGRYGAAAWSTDTKCYVGFGLNNNGVAADFWEYDPAKDSWMNRPASASKFHWGVSFTIAGKPYIGTRLDTDTSTGTMRRYDPATNIWEYLAQYPGVCSEASSFTIGNAGYVLGGFATQFSDEVWKFD